MHMIVVYMALERPVAAIYASHLEKQYVSAPTACLFVLTQLAKVDTLFSQLMHVLLFCPSQPNSYS